MSGTAHAEPGSEVRTNRIFSTFRPRESMLTDKKETSSATATTVNEDHVNFNSIYENDDHLFYSLPQTSFERSYEKQYQQLQTPMLQGTNDTLAKNAQVAFGQSGKGSTEEKHSSNEKNSHSKQSFLGLSRQSGRRAELMGAGKQNAEPVETTLYYQATDEKTSEINQGFY